MDDATRSAAPAIELPAAAATTVSPGDVFEDEPERYAIETQIGAGGMGTVLAARSARLRRTVALKVVTVDRDDLRRRFERETEVTARLQHPSIVPVYGAGRRGGQPFYAMKRVTGEPLDKVIAGAPSLPDRIALLPKVLAVTEAIAYAHSEGVIHRDLKPANIIVGAFGETVVIDWGLAKEIGQTDEAPADATPFRTSADATAHGKVMGTPAYMPLEQARGDAVDARADVYALGAILYHLLAGAAPYRERDAGSVPWETMLARVLSGPPAALPPDVPRDLVAIVDKAMARDAAARYPTASELADDLRKYQTGQLVGAHTYSLGQLVRRWLRKNRTAVMVAAVGLVVLAVFAAVSITSIVREQARTEEQRAAAVESRGRAEDLLGYMLVNLRDKLRPLGKVSLLADVATKARDYYSNHGETLSPSELEKRGIAMRNLGDVLVSENRSAESMAEYRAALAIALGLSAVDPSIVNRSDVAASHEKIGDVLWASGDTARALVEYRLQQTASAEVAADYPDDLKAQYNSALGHAAVAYILDEQGDYAGALAEDRVALGIMEAVVARDPATVHWLDGLGMVQSRIGDVLRDQGKMKEALAEYRQAATYFDKLVAADPRAAGQLRSRAIDHDKIGLVLNETGDHAGALAEFRTAMAMFEELATRDPSNKSAQRELAAAHGKLGEALQALKDFDGALAELRINREMFAALAAADPANAEHQGDLAIAMERVGTLLLMRGDRPGALAEFRAELAINTALFAKAPSNVTRQRNVSVAHIKLGNILITDDPKGALAEYRIALDIAEAVRAKHPGPDVDKAAAIAHFKVARALIATGDPGGAVAEYKPLLAIFEAEATKDPAASQGDLAELLEDVGDAELARGDTAAAHTRYAAALVIARAEASKAPTDTELADLVKRLARKGG